MPDSRPVLGVSACLLAGRSVLLVTRANPPMEGRLSLPGGRVEFGETLLAAARRELREETGLDVDALAFHCLHEAIGADFHAVIAVHAGRLEDGATFRAADDARTASLVAVADLACLEADGRTTPGLARIVAAVAAETCEDGPA